MLGTEQRHDLQSGRVGQSIDRAAALRVDAGVIGDQSNVLSAKWRKLQRFKNIETGLHARRVTGMLCVRLCGKAAGRRQREHKHEARCAQSFLMKSVHSNHPECRCLE